MGLMDKLKRKVKEQEAKEQKAENADDSTGDRLKNKVRGDNLYGDKQVEREGSGRAPGSPRDKKRRQNFRP